jgi:hypothetical protein
MRGYKGAATSPPTLLTVSAALPQFRPPTCKQVGIVTCKETTS